MKNEIKEKSFRYCKFEKLVYGTAVGTIFEGESWVDEFYTCSTTGEAEEIITKRFDRRLVLKYAELRERSDVSWEEKLGLISIIRGIFYICLFKVKLTEENTHDNFVNDIPWNRNIYARYRIVGDNLIQIYTEFPPNHPNGDAEWACAYCDFRGNLIEKFHSVNDDELSKYSSL